MEAAADQTSSHLQSFEDGTFDRGTSGLDFSSSRLIPLTGRYNWPLRTVGKIFFTKPDGNYVCSASIIRNRLVLTAGHCVYGNYAGKNQLWTNVMFVPAYHEGEEPYNKWNWSYMIVPGSWASNPSVPNNSDFALIET